MKKKPDPTPLVPPQTVEDVLLWACLCEIKPDMVHAYADFALSQGKGLTKKRKDLGIDALLRFANLGWTYYHHEGKQGRLPRSAP